MEKEINERKVPGFVLSTFLFLFFYLLIRTVYREASEMYYDMMDASIAEDEPVVCSLINACFEIVILCLSFWSIVRLLKGKPDGITCVRWALGWYLVIVLFQLFLLLGRIIAISWCFALSSVLQIIFIILFLLYLRRANSVKQLYPTSERKYSPGGWVWLSFSVLYICSSSYVIYSSIYKVEKQSKKIKSSSLVIPKDSYCDGYVMFKSNSNWIQSEKEIMDAEFMPQKVISWQSTNDSIRKFVLSGVFPKRRHSDFMSILLQSLPEEKKYFSAEVSSCDTIISDDQYYLDQYQFLTDSIPYLWTFSVRFDSKSHKFCALSNYGIQSNAQIDKNESLSFLKSVDFDLTPIIKEP